MVLAEPEYGCKILPSCWKVVWIILHPINHILVCYLWSLRYSEQLLVMSLKLVFSMPLRPLLDLKLMSMMVRSHRVSVYNPGTFAPALLALGLLKALLPTLLLISDI